MSLFIDTNVAVYAFHRADPIKQAIETARRFDIAIWDALIIEAARSAGCGSVLSEDLQGGQDFGGVRVISPFS